MRHVVLIRADKRNELPSVETLRDAGFFISSAVGQGGEDVTHESGQNDRTAERNRAGPAPDRDELVDAPPDEKRPWHG